MEYDVIVIGSGLGGLTAGALLAKRGLKVLLLEQHYHPGGCAVTFRRKDFTVEVGLHAMDGLDPGDLKREIFQELGVFDHVEFIRVPEFYRFTNGRVDMVIPGDFDKARRVLSERFPHEKAGIEKFFGVIRAIHGEVAKLPRENWKLLFLLPVFPLLFRNLVFREKATVGQFLDSIIGDEDLKLALLGNLVYYHDDPYTLSLIFFAVAQGSYFTGGGHYVKGGSQKLSDYLAGVIRSCGGEVLYRHLVTGILTKDGKAIGVRYRKTTGGDEEGEEAVGRAIIANASIPSVARDLLSPGDSGPLRSLVDRLEVAPSLTTLYLGFKRPVRELGNPSYTTFLFDGGVRNLSDMRENRRADYSLRNVSFVDFSLIDSGLTPEGKSFGSMVCVDYLPEWEGLGPDEYREKKEQVAKTFIRRLETLIPGIAEEIEYREVATPKTIRRFTLNPGGTAYGFAQTTGQAGRKRMKLRPPVGNLYFASAWLFSGGFSGAIMGGHFCAEEVWKRLRK